MSGINQMKQYSQRKTAGCIFVHEFHPCGSLRGTDLGVAKSWQVDKIERIVFTSLPEMTSPYRTSCSRPTLSLTAKKFNCCFFLERAFAAVNQRFSVTDHIDNVALAETGSFRKAASPRSIRWYRWRREAAAKGYCFEVRTCPTV